MLFMLIMLILDWLNGSSVQSRVPLLFCISTTPALIWTQNQTLANSIGVKSYPQRTLLRQNYPWIISLFFDNRCCKRILFFFNLQSIEDLAVQMSRVDCFISQTLQSDLPEYLKPWTWYIRLQCQFGSAWLSRYLLMSTDVRYQRGHFHNELINMPFVFCILYQTHS